jgi:hypothetical protein
MASYDPPAEARDAAGKAGPPPFDTSIGHQARVYNYVLGGCFLYS